MLDKPGDEWVRPVFDTWEEAARYWIDAHDHQLRYKLVYEKALCEIRDFVKRWPSAVHFNRLRLVAEKALEFSDLQDVNPGQPDANAGFAGEEEN